MSFHTLTTLTGYAREAVDLKSRMVDYHRSPLADQYLHAFLDSRFAALPERPHPDQPPAQPDPSVQDEVHDVMRRITALPWQIGEPYVLAPAMTAIVAAAAEALDLTDEVLRPDEAPDDMGVLFLPEPIYHRGPTGAVTSIGAITWAYTHTPAGLSQWAIAGWADHHDPLDPAAARRRAQLAQHPHLARQFGPYVLTDFAELPIGQPVQARPDAVVDDAERDWEPSPDGRFCIDETTTRTGACAAIVYAFWRISAQPLATVARPPLGRPTRRRAARAAITHDTRVVMLRRTHPEAEPPTGEAKWHYRVRFVVRGHWRRLIDKQGSPYRIWIHAHIKGPDGAPLLHGEKVAVLAR